MFDGMIRVLRWTALRLPVSAFSWRKAFIADEEEIVVLPSFDIASTSWLNEDRRLCLDRINKCSVCLIRFQL